MRGDWSEDGVFVVKSVDLSSCSRKQGKKKVEAPSKRAGRGSETDRMIRPIGLVDYSLREWEKKMLKVLFLTKKKVLFILVLIFNREKLL